MDPITGKPKVYEPRPFKKGCLFFMLALFVIGPVIILVVKSGENLQVCSDNYDACHLKCQTDWDERLEIADDNGEDIAAAVVLFEVAACREVCTDDRDACEFSSLGTTVGAVCLCVALACTYCLNLTHEFFRKKDFNAEMRVFEAEQKAEERAKHLRALNAEEGQVDFFGEHADDDDVENTMKSGESADSEGSQVMKKITVKKKDQFGELTCPKCGMQWTTSLTKEAEMSAWVTISCPHCAYIMHGIV